MRVDFNRSYNSSRLLFQQKVWRLMFLTSSCYIPFFFSWRQSQQQAKPPSDHTATILYLTVAPSLLSVALFATICYIIQTSLLICRFVKGGSAVFFLCRRTVSARTVVLRCGRARDFPENQLTFRDFFERSGKYWCFCRLVSRVVNQINTAFLSCNKKIMQKENKFNIRHQKEPSDLLKQGKI